jgi:hypothetical protein
LKKLHILSIFISNFIIEIFKTVRVIAHKEEELDNLFNEKQITIAAITESNTKLKGA